MNLGGLSPEMAPPVQAPLTLFYLLPLFLVLAGVLIAVDGQQLLQSRWSPATLAVTHFLVLGALAPVMCGALLQIAPVLLGAPYPGVRLVASLTAVGLGSGGLGIGLGFLFSHSWLLLAGAASVVAGLSIFLLASFRALLAVRHGGAATWTVRLATACLAVAIVLGATLTLARSGWIVLPDHLHWVDLHVAWGLGGWVGLLLAGIGMEIIPMFYVSPRFPLAAKRLLPALVLALLVLLSLLVMHGLSTPLRQLFVAVLAALLAAHAAYNLLALYIEHRRRRQHRDANLWLWQASHVSVPAAAAGWLLGWPTTLVGTLLIGGALAFVVGTLTKIVPFLSWLDLQQQRAHSSKQRVKLPSMRQILPPWMVAMIAVTLLAAVFCNIGAYLVPPLTLPGGLLLASCGTLLALALLLAGRTRRTVAQELALAQTDVSGKPPMRGD